MKKEYYQVFQQEFQQSAYLPDAEAKQKTTARQQQITAQHLQQKQPQKSLQKQQAAQQNQKEQLKQQHLQLHTQRSQQQQNLFQLSRDGTQKLQSLMIMYYQTKLQRVARWMQTTSSTYHILTVSTRRRELTQLKLENPLRAIRNLSGNKEQLR